MFIQDENEQEQVHAISRKAKARKSPCNFHLEHEIGEKQSIFFCEALRTQNIKQFW